nr:uncharacterized protein LOC109400506 isoform X2 [Aedes albopictus]
MEQEAAAAVPADVEGRCRLCFSVEDLTCSLFLPEGEPSREVIDMILECTSIRITLAEDYPSKVCEKCLETLDKFHHYRQRCLQNDKILKSHRSRSKAKPAQEHRPPVQVKQEPEHLDDIGDDVASAVPEPPEPDQHPQAVKQEDPGGCSSILRSILLQSRESGRAASTASAEHETEQDNLPAHPSEDEDHKDLAPKEEQPQLPPAQASLLQQMLLQQQGYSTRETHSPAHTPGPSHVEASPSLLKRMLLEGGGGGGGSSQQDRQSPLEGPSTLNHRPPTRTESHQQELPINHHHHHDENHNEEHSETPLASQLRAILLQHRAAAAAVASTSTTTVPTTPTFTNSTSTHHEQQSQQLQLQQQSHQQQQQHPHQLEKPEVSYLRSLFMRDDSDGNEDSDGETAAAAAAAAVDPNEQANRDMWLSIFQELQARNVVQNSFNRAEMESTSVNGVQIMDISDGQYAEEVYEIIEPNNSHPTTHVIPTATIEENAHQYICYITHVPTTLEPPVEPLQYQYDAIPNAPETLPETDLTETTDPTNNTTLDKSLTSYFKTFTSN